MLFAVVGSRSAFSDSVFDPERALRNEVREVEKSGNVPASWQVVSFGGAFRILGTTKRYKILLKETLWRRKRAAIDLQYSIDRLR